MTLCAAGWSGPVWISNRPHGDVYIRIGGGAPIMARNASAKINRLGRFMGVGLGKTGHPNIKWTAPGEGQPGPGAIAAAAFSYLGWPRAGNGRWICFLP